MPEEPRAYPNKRRHEVKAHQVPLDHLTSCPLEDSPLVGIAYTAERDKERSWPDGEEEEIIKGHGESNDECLGDFDSIDTRQNVERIGCERGKEYEVDVVKRT